MSPREYTCKNNFIWGMFGVAREGKFKRWLDNFVSNGY